MAMEKFKKLKLEIFYCLVSRIFFPQINEVSCFLFIFFLIKMQDNPNGLSLWSDPENINFSASVNLSTSLVLLTFGNLCLE